MYTKRSNSYGLNTNVSLDPSANAKSNQSINNTVVIQPGPQSQPVREHTETRQIPIPVSEENPYKFQTGNVEALPEVSQVPIYPTITTVSYPSVTPRSVNTNNETRSEVDRILLEVYGAILLTQNKQLLANILSKSHIIITKADLERVISAKLNQQCSVVVADELFGCGCTAKISPILKIDSIRIINDNNSLDFKTAFNSEYNEMNDVYKLSLKYVVA